MFTVLIYRLFFQIIHSKNVYLSLLVLTCGVMLVCATNLKFHWTGFCFALGSTFVFVIQNIFSKSIFSAASLNLRNTVKIDKLSLLFYSAAMAFLFMIPIWWASEGYQVLSTAKLDLNLLALFLLNGFTHFTQAILAFSVLTLVSPITYSIASLVKRIFVIVASICWFGDRVNFAQGFGITITFLGLYLYHLAEKEVDKGERKILEMQRRRSNVHRGLPTFSDEEMKKPEA
jgi:drug/metabolite transporter (DMT)-like permease